MTDVYKEGYEDGYQLGIHARNIEQEEDYEILFNKYQYHFDRNTTLTKYQETTAQTIVEDYHRRKDTLASWNASLLCLGAATYSNALPITNTTDLFAYVFAASCLYFGIYGILRGMRVFRSGKDRE